MGRYSDMVKSVQGIETASGRSSQQNGSVVGEIEKLDDVNSELENAVIYLIEKLGPVLREDPRNVPGHSSEPSDNSGRSGMQINVKAAISRLVDTLDLIRRLTDAIDL